MDAYKNNLDAALMNIKIAIDAMVQESIAKNTSETEKTDYTSGVKHESKNVQLHEKVISEVAFQLRQDRIYRFHFISDIIHSVGYDEKNCLLYVKFNSGDKYVYEHVSKFDAKEFINADSVGRHFNKNIRNKYTSRKL